MDVSASCGRIRCELRGRQLPKHRGLGMCLARPYIFGSTGSPRAGCSRNAAATRKEQGRPEHRHFSPRIIPVHARKRSRQTLLSPCLSPHRSMLPVVVCMQDIRAHREVHGSGTAHFQENRGPGRHDDQARTRLAASNCRRDLLAELRKPSAPVRGARLASRQARPVG